LPELLGLTFHRASSYYLATRSEREEFDHAEAIERRHIKTFPAGEREEVSEILRGLGIAGDLLKRVVAAVTADRDRRVRMILLYEYGLPAAVRSPWRASGSTFAALLSAVQSPGLMFVLIGALKSRWSVELWWRSGLMTLAMGGGAAAVAYAIGAWLRNVAG